MIPTTYPGSSLCCCALTLQVAGLYRSFCVVNRNRNLVEISVPNYCVLVSLQLAGQVSGSGLVKRVLSYG